MNSTTAVYLNKACYSFLISGCKSLNFSILYSKSNFGDKKSKEQGKWNLSTFGKVLSKNQNISDDYK